MTPEYNLRLHIIEVLTGKMLAQPWAYSIPCIGDEVRIEGPRYYEVVKVVHVYDEDCDYHRANIGVKEAK
jgi:hypothetical protein